MSIFASVEFRFVTVSCSMTVINPYPSYFLDIHLKNKLLIRDN